jgi:hypothetical protein
MCGVILRAAGISEQATATGHVQPCTLVRAAADNPCVRRE